MLPFSSGKANFQIDFLQKQCAVFASCGHGALFFRG